MNVNMHEAKTRLSELVRRAESGETVIINRKGQPVARLVPVPADASARPLGIWKGQWQATDAAFTEATDREVANLFYDGDAEGHREG